MRVTVVRGGGTWGCGHWGGGGVVVSEFSVAWGKRGEGGQGREGVQLPDSPLKLRCNISIITLQLIWKCFFLTIHFYVFPQNLYFEVINKRSYHNNQRKTKYWNVFFFCPIFGSPNSYMYFSLCLPYLLFSHLQGSFYRHYLTCCSHLFTGQFCIFREQNRHLSGWPQLLGQVG